MHILIKCYLEWFASGECLIATRNEIWKMHVKGSVSLINILTKLIFPISSYNQPKIKSKSELSALEYTIPDRSA